MSDIGAMVDALIEAGTPPAVAARIVAEAFVAGSQAAPYRGDEQAARRRERDRERARLRRQKSAESADSPQISADVPNVSPPVPAKDPEPQKQTLTPSHPPKEKPPYGGQKESPPSRSKPARQLPDDWQPSEVDRSYAASKGLSPAEIRSESERFADHHRARGNTMRDWAAAWRTWVTSPYRQRAGPQSHAPPIRNPHVAALYKTAAEQGFDLSDPGTRFEPFGPPRVPRSAPSGLSGAGVPEPETGNQSGPLLDFGPVRAKPG